MSYNVYADPPSSTTAVPIILIASTLSGIVGVVIVLLIVMMMCVIALWRKQPTQKRGSSSKRGTKIWKFQLDTQCSNFVNKIIQANAVSKIHIPEGFIVFLSLLSDADDAGTELRTETQRSRTSLATPAFTLQLQGSTRSTTSYYVNEGLGPISVNGGDHGNELSHEYDSIPANVNPIPMATNPAYQSTSYPSSTSGAIWDKNFVSANTRKEGHTSRKQIAG